jgi:hypothetical protein
VNNAIRIRAATRRARAFQAAERINPFGSPPDWQSALHEYRQRTPRPPPGTVIAIHTSTDGPAVLRRILGEDDRWRAIEADRKRRWRAARSPEQVDRDRTRDRDWRRIKRAGRRSAPSAG